MLSDDLKIRAPEIAEDFHRLYYDDYENTWETTTWFGHLVRKNPCDLWIYQELIFECKPDIIIETGTAYGGSTLYLANLLASVGGRRVISIDIIGTQIFPDRPNYPQIRYIRGDSGSAQVKAQVEDLIHLEERDADRSLKVMAILDAEHAKEHVLRELEIYPALVSPGQYLIVEDTNLNGRPVSAHHGPGPAEALEEWLPNHPEFKIDRSRERYYLTFNAGGYLKKVN